MRGFYIVIFTRPALSLAMRGLSENLQCKKPLFLTKCWDPLELSKRKKLLDLDYIYPGGVRTGSHLFFWGKSGFLKHMEVEMRTVRDDKGSGMKIKTEQMNQLDEHQQDEEINITRTR